MDVLFFDLLPYSYCELEQIKDALFNLSINGDIRKVGVIWETAVLVRHRGTSLEYE